MFFTLFQLSFKSTAGLANEYFPICFMQLRNDHKDKQNVRLDSESTINRCLLVKLTLKLRIVIKSSLWSRINWVWIVSLLHSVVVLNAAMLWAVSYLQRDILGV